MKPGIRMGDLRRERWEPGRDMGGEKRPNMDIETRYSRNTEEERKCIRRGR